MYSYFSSPLLCFLPLLLSVSLPAPDEDSVCRKRLCVIVSLCVVAFGEYRAFPWICSKVKRAIEGKEPGRFTKSCHGRAIKGNGVGELDVRGRVVVGRGGWGS